MNRIFLASSQVTDSKVVHVISNIIGVSFVVIIAIIAAGYIFVYAKRAFIWIRFKTTGKVPKDLAEEIFWEDPMHNDDPYEKNDSLKKGEEQL